MQRNRHQPMLVADEAKKADSAAFPDGMVPIALPDKRMGGRIRTARGGR